MVKVALDTEECWELMSHVFNAVLEAVADGWRIVQFPIAKLYEYREVDNDYIGYEFILERWN